GFNNRAVYPSVTIEFDTFDNNYMGFTGDLAADHTGIYLNGDVALPDPANTLLSAVAIGAGGEIEDGKYHITRYVWDPATQNFTYYFDGVQLASVTRDLVSYFGSSYVRFGFAAATGASKNLQKACWLDEPALVDPGYDLTGTIFEDVNYGGGAGRDLATASGEGVTAAVVELYDASGNLVSTTTTAADGGYTFNNVLDGSYHVRVVSDTVSSTRTGANGSELGVQTFRTDGTTAVTGEVGGRKPAVADGTANGGAETLNATTFALSGGGAVQSLQPVTVAGADIAGIDFGFNFDTIVNTNDSGQGSLRQFIVNSNLLTDIPNQGINAGQETSIFMVPDGSAYAGTESHTTLDLTTAGVVVIKPATVLPIITDDAVSVDGSTQSGASCGGIRDANGAITDRSILVALDGTNAGTGATADGLTIGSADGVTVKGLSIGHFDSDGLRADNSTNFTATCNHIGLAANGITLAGNDDKGIVLNGVTSADIGDATVSGMNVVGANTNDGIWMEGTIDDVIIDMNYVGIAADGNTSVGNGRGYVGSGISFAGYTGNIVSDGEIIRNNVISGNGFELGGFYGTTNNVLIENNLLGTDATGLLDRTDQWYLIIAEDNEGWIIRNNVIAGSDQGSGIELYSMSNMTIQGNKIGVGIDGTTAIGNGFWGIRIDGGAGHVIGGLGAGEGNIVANNSQDSVNGYSGILIQGGAAATISGNSIHSNLASGVEVISSTSLVTISRNQIFNNTGLGIDLNGNEVTNNDANDVDTGANSLLNFPQFKQSILVGSNLIISGCAPAGATIELFEADVSPTSVSGVAAGSNQFGETQDYGEGEVFLTSWVMPASGTACAMSTDADGNNPSGMLAFSQTFALTSLPAGTNIELNDKLTATATVSGTGTSEFSAIGLIVANKLNGIVFEDINYGGGAGRDQ
ncbi:MAG: SdrD B-like domain-containing protein, partial [Thiothrix litoralis]